MFNLCILLKLNNRPTARISIKLFNNIYFTRGRTTKSVKQSISRTDSLASESSYWIFVQIICLFLMLGVLCCNGRKLIKNPFHSVLSQSCKLNGAGWHSKELHLIQHLKSDTFYRAVSQHWINLRNEKKEKVIQTKIQNIIHNMYKVIWYRPGSINQCHLSGRLI